jgi:oligopeptide/dipeptide ABC transporter ATP-binding protein
VTGRVLEPALPASAPDTGPPPALTIENLVVTLVGDGRRVPVVTGVDLRVPARSTLGLVGESASGKSLTCLAVMRLLDRRRLSVESGSIRLGGRELLELSEDEMRAVRGNEIGMIFQDPMTSLDPAFTAGQQIASVVRRHTGAGRRGARTRALELLSLVGIGDPARRADQYPHQFSGGMRQRIMIAMAIAGEPRLLIADEPTTALDATTQAQIIELIRDLTETLGMATIITTHDLGVVAELCDRVSVMYAGQIVEHTETAQLFHQPRHPYTERLLAGLPRVGRPLELLGIAGAPPRPGHFAAGCRFAPRCTHVRDPLCTAAPPPLHELGRGCSVRCARVAELALPGVGA